MSFLLDGTWQITKALKGGIKVGEPARLEFSGDTFRRITDSSTWVRRFKIDESNSPAWFTIYPETDPFKGETLLGIVKVEGNTLSICHSSPGEPRPEVFHSPSDGEIVLSVSQR